jgi:glutamine synthetase
LQAREALTKEDAKRIVEERGLSHMKLGLTDIDDARSREKFLLILEKGMGFCDVRA